MRKSPPIDKQKITLSITYIYASWLVLQIFLTKFGLDALHTTRFLDTVAAVVHRPFVYRALVPTLVRSLSTMIPHGATDPLENALYQPEILPTHATPWGIQYVWFALLAWGCFIGFAYCIRWLTRYFYPAYSPHILDFGVPLAALFALPLFFRHFNFVYDPATILLFPLALVCLLQERYLLYVLILALCALNKETSVLLIPAFVVHARSRGMKTVPMIALAALQLAICLGIYKYISISMADRPGVPMEIQIFKYNLMLPIKQPYAFVWLLCVGSFFIYFASRDWKTKPPFLRHSLVFMLIPHTAMLIVVGCLDEIRIFYEVYAVTVLLMTPTLVGFVRDVTGASDEPRTPTNTPVPADTPG